MKFDFESIINREGKDAAAVDYFPYKDMQIKDGFSKIPMWIADMNFKTVPTVSQMMIDRAKHPLYGYFAPRQEYYDAIIKWHSKRFGNNDLTEEYIGYENGVLGGLVSALNTLCSKGDYVLIQIPAYIGFTNTLINNGFQIVTTPLKLDEHNVWRMDYEDMEEKIKANHVHAVVFCSPHNPTGRVWTRDELERAMGIFQKYNVYVISDEIWADIVLNRNKHLPTQLVSEDAKMRTIALYAPSKTFNLAGLVGSYHIIYNQYLRERIDKEASLSHYNSMNMMSMYALIGAYQQEGYEWTDELCSVLTENVEYAYNYIKEHFKSVRISKPEGTYMLLLDCEEWCKENGKTIDELQKRGVEVGVVWQDGRPFHMPYGIRINLALPKSLIEEAMRRLDKYVFNSF